jgi:hypothetical protein
VYSKEEIEQMRERLAESEWEGLRDKDLKQILWDGCLGWAMMSDDEIIEQYKDYYEE